MPKKVKTKDFEKLELRVGTIKAVKNHSNGRDYILAVDLGPVERDLQIVASLKESYSMNKLIGRQVVVIANIEHQLIERVESQAMLLITTLNGKTRLISPDVKVLPGVKVHGLIDGKRTHKE